MLAPEPSNTPRREPAGNPLNTPAFEPAPKEAAGGPFAGLSAAISHAREQALNAANAMTNTAGLKETFAAALGSALENTWRHATTTPKLIYPIAFAITHSAFTIFTALGSSTADALFNGALSAALIYFTAKHVKQRLTVNSPEKLAEVKLAGFNQAARAMSRRLDEGFSELAEAITESSHPGILRSEENREILGRRLDQFRLIHAVSIQSSQGILALPDGGSDVLLTLNKRYCGLFLKVAGAVESYFDERSKLLSRGATTAEHLELNDASEQLLDAVKEIQANIPRYNFKMPEPSAFNPSNYTQPSIWGMLIGRVPARAAGK